MQKLSRYVGGRTLVAARTVVAARKVVAARTLVAARTVVAIIAAATAFASLATFVPANATTGPNARSYRAVATCSRPAAPNAVRCLALRRQTMVSGRAVGFGLKSRGDSAQVNGDAGFGATALRKAYAIRALGSRANVIAIVDATHSGSAFDDVSEYRKTFGLPALTDCTLRAAAKGGVPSGTKPCFIQIDQSGAPSRSAATQDTGWAQEIALDLEMASAACPKCSLLLVEANTASFEDLSVAVGTAAAFGGVRSISNSYGGSDVSADSFQQYSLAAASGIAVTASSGDFGFGVESPASFDGVVAVGGTSLSVDANGSWLGESAWVGSGSGCSALNPKPSWQVSFESRCLGKATADVAAVADPATGVSVFFNGGWYVFGGTSASAPLIAGLYALKNDFGRSAGDFTALNVDKLHDITSGTNASSTVAKRACKFDIWCKAATGFDGPTGLGTPFGSGAF